MPNVREIMARLNPTTVKYDTGRGGIPELSNVDIAGALGMIPTGLGREVLIACSWPDALNRNLLMKHVRELMFGEWNRQQQAVLDAKIDYGIAIAVQGCGGAVTHEQRAELDRATRRLEAVRSKCWPDTMPEMLTAMASAALVEIAYPHRCPECGGGKKVMNEPMRACQICKGTGRIRVSDGSRAASLKRSRPVYLRSWREPYEWLLSRMRDAEADAALALCHALGEGGVLT